MKLLTVNDLPTAFNLLMSADTSNQELAIQLIEANFTNKEITNYVEEHYTGLLAFTNMNWKSLFTKYRLDFTHRKLSNGKIPNNIKQLTNITQLSLTYNTFTTIPDAVCEMTSLTGLNIGFNKLQHINPNITKLVNLEALYLYANSTLTTLHDSIYDMSNLTILYLNGTSITGISNKILKLTKLHTLYLNGLDIAYILQYLMQMKSLLFLSVGNTNLSDSELAELKLALPNCKFI